MSLALTTTHENSYFRRSIGRFSETTGRVERITWPVWRVTGLAAHMYPHWRGAYVSYQGAHVREKAGSGRTIQKITFGYLLVFLPCLQAIHVCHGQRGVMVPECCSLSRDASPCERHQGLPPPSQCMEQAATPKPRTGAMPPRCVPTAHARCAGSAPQPVPPRWRRSASTSAHPT